MDSRQTFYIAVLVICLAFLRHNSVGSERDICLPYFVSEQPYCVQLIPMKEAETATNVVFSLYRKPTTLHQALFNFSKNSFSQFYNCLSNASNICKVQFNKSTQTYSYTANQVNTEQDNSQPSEDYWICSVPLYPENGNDIIIKCQLKAVGLQTLPCNLLKGLCSSVGIIKKQNQNKTPVKVIWTSPFLGDINFDCKTKYLGIQYKISNVTVYRCSADAGNCNDSIIAVTKDCDETPADADQSDASSPTTLIIGIVCGIIVLIVLAVLCAFFLRQKMRNKQSSTTSVISSTSATLAPLPSAQDSDKNDSGVFLSSRDAGSNNMSSNIPKNNLGVVLSYDSLDATNTIIDSETTNSYATIPDTEVRSVNPSGSNDKRVGNRNDASAEISQHSSVDGADAAGNGYSKLGEQVRNFKNPYNVLLKPKEDPKARNPISIPDESTRQPSRYSLAQPILDGGSSRPVEVVDIVYPAHNPDKTSEKDNAKASESKSTNDYDYPSDEEIPVKRKDPMYFELEKEEDIAETATSGGDTDRPYFELEKVEASDTDYGLAYPNQGFDPQE